MDRYQIHTSEKLISIEAFPFPILIHDRTRIIVLNQLGRNLHGFQEGDILPEDLLVPESQEKQISFPLERIIRIKATDHFRYYKCTTDVYPFNSQECYITILFNYDVEQQQISFIDKVPIGIYETDDKGILRNVNSSVLHMFGYSNKSQMMGHPVKEFYAYPEDEDKIARLIDEKGVLEGEPVQLLRANGKPFFAKLYTTSASEGGSEQGRKGTILDVTIEEQYKRILQEVPLGFYIVEKNNNGDDIIIECNQRFAELFDFASVEDVKGISIRTLYDNADDFNRFINNLEDNHRRGEALIGGFISVQSLRGRHFTIEIWSRAYNDPKDKKIIGRVGLIRPAPEYQLNMLIKDIGIVLHPYTGMLQELGHTLSSIEETVFGGQSTHAIELERIFLEPEKKLLDRLNNLLLLKDEIGRKDALSDSAWERLKVLHDSLQNYRSRIEYPGLYPESLRGLCFEIRSILKKTGIGLPRKLVREICDDAYDIECISLRYSIRLVGERIVEIDHQTKALREYIISNAKQGNLPEECSIRELVKRAIAQQALYINSRGVDIVKKNSKYNEARIVAVKDDIIRALGSLLHNAIKYSWKRSKGRRPWIEIEITKTGEKVSVVFENYGVPIAPEEIETGAIFEIGHRGRYAGDEGRLGSGIGLADAKAVARRYGGDVRVESRPASDILKRAENPFITRVSFSLLCLETTMAVSFRKEEI